jgi:chemosensory pili system protein ChpA (sensor histidine kinase/response regulator)
VVIRALPAHLRRRAVRGASIASDGRLFLVLDIADLLTDALGGKTAPPTRPIPAAVPSRDRTPVVLVVDDSISIRHALEGALSGVGYDVRLARDGVEALGAMIADLPDIMVLDLEMPRLDGFELLSVIRGNESLARTPVVILTSRAAEKYHRQAMELGVRAYLTKPCPDEVLITTLQRVLRESQ